MLLEPCQYLIVLSIELDTKLVPDGENWAAVMLFVWPFRGIAFCEGLKEYRVSEESSEPQSRYLCEGSISHAVIAPRGPLKVRFSWGSVGPGLLD